MPSRDDVLVVGGGVIGLACAHYLLKSGRQVRLIEQARIGAGASSGNCGLIVVSGLIPLCFPGVVGHEIRRLFKRTSPLYIKPSPDLKRIRWLLNFSRHCSDAHLKHVMEAREPLLRASSQLYETLIREEKLSCEWQKRGALIVCRSESKMAAYAADNDLLKPFGLAARPYIGGALQKLEPALRADVYGAWHHESDSHLRPETLLQEWQRILLQRGLSVEEHCPVRAFRYSADRVEGALTPKGTFSAGQYVLAAGAWSGQLLGALGIGLPIQPGKGYSITTTRPANCPQIPCILSEHKVVVTPWSSGYRLGGTMEFSGLNTRVVPNRLQNLRRAAREYLKMPLGEGPEEEWVGLRPMLYDDLPVIDRVPGKRNLFVATGHGMLGISLAPATGKLISEMICERSPHIDAMPFSLRRFA